MPRRYVSPFGGGLRGIEGEEPDNPHYGIKSEQAVEDSNYQNNS